jgi:hypothetical protein
VESAVWTAPGAAEVDHRVVRLRLRGASGDMEGAPPPKPPLRPLPRRYRVTPEVLAALAALAAPGACTAAQAAAVLAAKAAAEAAAAPLDFVPVREQFQAIVCGMLEAAGAQLAPEVAAGGGGRRPPVTGPALERQAARDPGQLRALSKTLASLRRRRQRRNLQGARQAVAIMAAASASSFWQAWRRTNSARSTRRTSARRLHPPAMQVPGAPLTPPPLRPCMLTAMRWRRPSPRRRSRTRSWTCGKVGTLH